LVSEYHIIRPTRNPRDPADISTIGTTILNVLYITFLCITFALHLHLADAFIQSYLHHIQGMYSISTVYICRPLCVYVLINWQMMTVALYI